jgi:Uma2 family endonuclease
MTITTGGIELALRSHDASWDRARWELLPDDGNRYEVIAGVLYMTTAPSNYHQWITRQIFLALFGQLDSNDLGLTLWSPIGLFMPGCDPVQPDLLFVRTANLGIIRDKHIYGVPALLIEILSPSNAAQDLEIKRRAYARAGVPEYWIARPTERDLLAYDDPDPATGGYRRERRFTSEDELIAATLPFRASVESFFAGAPDTTI